MLPQNAREIPLEFQFQGVGREGRERGGEGRGGEGSMEIALMT
jgi:hypothetical protein